MKARQKGDGRLPISPMKSIAKTHTSREQGGRREGIQEMETRMMDEEGTVWWGPPAIEEEQPEREERHPQKMWADEVDSEPNEEDMDDDSNNGLGQDGLRPNELNDDDEDVAGAAGRGGTHDDQSGDSASSRLWMKDKKDSNREIQKRKNAKTAREWTREPKSQEFRTAASPQTARGDPRTQEPKQK